MIIENPDTFKSWLTSILEPLCDADPAALAKYVYALVKKDKPVEELREVMVDQLDVFLQQETKPFVEMLFKSLESQEYLKPGAVETQPTLPNDAPMPDKENDVENHDTQAASNGPSPPSPLGGGAAPPRVAPGPAAAPRHRLVVSRAHHARLAAAPPSLPPPPPARAPPQEQTLVKVMPLTELLEEPVDQLPRRRDRRGDSLRDKDDRRRRRSRSWERRQRGRRHPREPDHAADPPPPPLPRRHDRRAASRSPSPRGRYRNRSPPLPDRQLSRSRSRSPTGVRERDHERERDRLRVPRDIERDRMSRDREHRDRVSRSRDRERSRSRSTSMSPGADGRLDRDGYKRRCRDYDEKGYCMRGDLCQWDHGADPVVLEDAALTRVLTIPPTVPEYNPLTPDIWCGAGAGAGGGGFPAYPPPHLPHLPHQHPHLPQLHPHQMPPRELIPIPRYNTPRLRHETPSGPPPRHAAPLKKNFDYNRLGASRPPPAGLAGNCSLVVKKVPRGMNDITHLNNHFSKFGKIVNIQVCYAGDPEAALMTFSSPTEASVAYKSTEAVLNNRFIKVFWHNPDQNKQENQAPSNQQKPADRPNSQHPMSHNKVLINRDNIKATADIKNQLAEKEKETNGEDEKKESVVPVPGAVLKPEPIGAVVGAGAGAKAPEKGKRVMEMCRRAQGLLHTQLQQQVLLIQRLESGNVQGPEKAVLMEAINSAQEGIEKLQKELVAYNGTLKQIQDESVARSLSRLQLAQVNAKRPKTREEAQKEILDAELDMFTKQQEGQDVTDLAKRIAELRRQMSLQFPSHTTMRRPHSRGGRFNTPTRFTRGGLMSKVYSVNQTVDHRPRALLISGFEPDELDPLLAHFSQFGEVCHKAVEPSVPQLVLQYRLRAHAERAAAHARHYNDRTLSITWVSSNNSVGGKAAGERAAPAPLLNGDDTHDAHDENKEQPQQSEDPLMRFDEEEEEDADEDRSWRR